MRCKLILLIVFTVFFVQIEFITAQEIDVTQLETEVSELESILIEHISQRENISKNVSELASKITILKQREKLNYFQRNRLEGYLKSSQQLTNQTETVQKNISSLTIKLEQKRKQLINYYDKEVKKILAILNSEKMDPQFKKNNLKNLTRIKRKRDSVQAKLDLDIHSPINIDIENGDNALQITQKADWLKDQEDKLRTDAAELEYIMINLKEEIEIREKMTEFEQDISLFDHRDEPMAQEGFQNNEQRSADEINNAFLQNEDYSKSSVLPLFPNISIEKDVSNFNNIDIEMFIKGLEERRDGILSAADSLTIKAKELYEKAEQAKIIEKQD